MANIPNNWTFWPIFWYIIAFYFVFGCQLPTDFMYSQFLCNFTVWNSNCINGQSRARKEGHRSDDCHILPQASFDAWRRGVPRLSRLARLCTSTPRPLPKRRAQIELPQVRNPLLCANLQAQNKRGDALRGPSHDFYSPMVGTSSPLERTIIT